MAKSVGRTRNGTHRGRPRENNKLVGTLNLYPEQGASLDALQSMPAENIGDCIRQQIDAAAKGQRLALLGSDFLE